MKKISNILIIALVSVFSLAVGASAATTIASSSVSYGDTTVKGALDELMTIANQCPSGALCSKVSIGDYVKMTPTQTSFTIPTVYTGYDSNQTINPSELNLWRVIDIKSDGTIEMVSEYVSSTGVFFKGRTGYLNFVGTLNTIANQYGNSKYTIRARHMGYNGQTQVITDTSKFTATAPWTAFTSDNSNETVGGGDIMYTYDTDSSFGLVNRALGTVIASKPTGEVSLYWLASRYYYYYEVGNYNWIGLYIDDNGGVNTLGLYGYHDFWYELSYGLSVRPIVTLRSNITSYKGSGTSTSPWVLS